jgi:hypothetical protein
MALKIKRVKTKEVLECQKKETRLLSVFIIFGKSFATWLQNSFPVQLIQRFLFFKNVPKEFVFLKSPYLDNIGWSMSPKYSNDQKQTVARKEETSRVVWVLVFVTIPWTLVPLL